MIDYIAAGLDPLVFWGLTPRLYDLHMRGASRRIERELEIANRQAYNVALLSRFKRIPRFEQVFRQGMKPAQKQSAQVLEANLQALAKAWGAMPT